MPQSCVGLRRYVVRNFRDLHEKRCSHILNPFSDVRAQYGRFKGILFLRLLQTSSRDVQTRICFLSSLAVSGAVLRACNAIFSLRALFLSFRLYANKFAAIVATREMSASWNKITSPDNTRHFILSVLLWCADKASHKFFNTFDLKNKSRTVTYAETSDNYPPVLPDDDSVTSVTMIDLSQQDFTRRLVEIVILSSVIASR